MTMRRKKPIDKKMLGTIVKSRNSLWVVVQCLDEFNLCACPIINGVVQWRRKKFLGESWKRTRRKKIKIPKEKTKNSQSNFHRFIDIPYEINYL